MLLLSVVPPATAASDSDCHGCSVLPRSEASASLSEKLCGASGMELYCSLVLGFILLLWYLGPLFGRQLVCRDGWYNPQAAEPTGFGSRLFEVYRMCRFGLDFGIPGLAYNRPPLLWLTSGQVLQNSVTDSQENFYKEAGIQTAVFIPCASGVIELGATQMVQASQQSISVILSHLQSLLSPSPTSTTSTLNESPESSSIMSLDPSPLPQLPIQTLRTQELGSELQQILFPQHQPQNYYPMRFHKNPGIMPQTAFIRWRGPSSLQGVNAAPSASQLAFKRSISMLHRILSAQRLEHMPSSLGASSSRATPQQTNAASSSSSQLHHMISERRRREKLKESFEALRAFLPPNSRKDKASILENIRQYLTSLKTRVDDLESMNKQLRSELEHGGSNSSFCLNQPESPSSHDSTNVTVYSSSEDQLLVYVTIERNPRSTVDTVTKLLKHLRDSGFSVISTSASSDPHTPGPLRFHAYIKLSNETQLQPADTDVLKENLRKELLAAVKEEENPK